MRKAHEQTRCGAHTETRAEAGHSVSFVCFVPFYWRVGVTSFPIHTTHLEWVVSGLLLSNERQDHAALFKTSFEAGFRWPA